MEFRYTILYVKSVAETLSFYESAFGFDTKFITPEGDYGELLTGETTLSFASVELGESNIKTGFRVSDENKKPFGMELAFTTNEIEADFDRAITAGAILVAPIQAKPWGQKVGYLKDNNGFLIEVCTPINTTV
jgi:uncharacterized glyoxalase superfamily protein PhnB